MGEPFRRPPLECPAPCGDGSFPLPGSLDALSSVLEVSLLLALRPSEKSRLARLVRLISPRVSFLGRGLAWFAVLVGTLLCHFEVLDASAICSSHTLVPNPLESLAVSFLVSLIPFLLPGFHTSPPLWPPTILHSVDPPSLPVAISLHL